MPYPYAVRIPEIVGRAHRQAERLGFPLMPEGRPIGKPAPVTATTPFDGALLRALAAARPGGHLGEVGTGPGVSAAWLLSGMAGGADLVSCDIDADLAAAAAAFFADREDVTVLAGDWEEVLPREPAFDLLFFDGNPRGLLADRANWDTVVDLIAIGGQIVMDDLAPVELWPPEWEGMTDHKREFCLFNPRLAGVEVRTSARTVSVVGTRIA